MRLPTWTPRSPVLFRVAGPGPPSADDEAPTVDDDCNDVTLPTEPPTPARTTWTLLLYLTSAAEGCVGGETVFYPRDRKSSAEEIAVPPETGMLLLHKHGADCLLVSLALHGAAAVGLSLADCGCDSTKAAK